MKNKDISAYLTILGAVFFWSFSFIWFKIAYEGYKPITVVIFRLIIASALTFAIALIIKQLQVPKGKDLRLFILMSFFEPFIYFIGESYGLKYVSSTVAAVIVATIPLLAPIAAWYFYREKVSWMNVFGLIFSFAGVGMVVMTNSFQFDADPLGIGLEFIAVFAAIAYSIVLRKIVFKYNSLSIVAWQNLIGIVFFLPIWLVVDLSDFTAQPYHERALTAIVFLAVFASTLAFIFFTKSIRKLGVTRSNTFVNLIPVFVAILSYFILSETLETRKIIGIIVVIIGLFLAQSQKNFFRKKQSPIGPNF
jgi:drug/metabolite transporter (DMT)-like permease